MRITEGLIARLTFQYKKPWDDWDCSLCFPTQDKCSFTDTETKEDVKVGKNGERKLKMKDLKEEKSSNTFSGSLGVEGWINILPCAE